MDISLILKLAGIGFIVSIVVQLLNKSGRDEQGIMIIIAGIIVAFFMIVSEMGNLFDEIKGLFDL